MAPFRWAIRILLGYLKLEMFLPNGKENEKSKRSFFLVCKNSNNKHCNICIFPLTAHFWKLFGSKSASNSRIILFYGAIPSQRWRELILESVIHTTDASLSAAASISTRRWSQHMQIVCNLHHAWWGNNAFASHVPSWLNEAYLIFIWAEGWCLYWPPSRSCRLWN